LTSYAAIPDLKPVYHTKVVYEGNYHNLEEMRIQKHGDSYTEIRIKRMKDGEIQIDTIISAPNAGYDMLNIFLFVQAFDYSRLKTGDSFNLTAFMGDKKANIIVRYAGQTIF
jgi:hypothetical protein